DFICSLVMIIILLPLFFLIGLSIKIEDKGPMFFKQDRLGKEGKIFKIYKFRTMIVNAEKVGTGLSTFEGDSRVTKIGRFLRKTSLDEIPQLINILKGDMSFIGPRPPVPYHPRKIHDYNKQQKLRFNVRPGISGYAQVKGRNSLTWDERIEYDIQYVKNQSFFLDFKIAVLTVVKIFKREDIHGPNRRNGMKDKVN